MACSTKDCDGVPGVGETACARCKEVKRIRDEARGVRDTVKGWRKNYGGNYNAGNNFVDGVNYKTKGGLNNPIVGTREAIEYLVRSGELDGSDKGVFKFRYLHNGNHSILVHVEAKK
jgi:hypothetical protein